MTSKTANPGRRLMTLIAALGLLGAASPRQIDFQHLDLNGDGVIDRDEAPRKAAFDGIDTDGNGEVTESEFNEYINPLPAAPEINKQVHRDIVYYSDSQLRARNIDNSALVSLDIYQPEHGRNLPVVAYVHGGSWQRGDKRAVHSKADFFLASGFIFASINYRLRPAVGMDTLQQDTAAAVAWLHRNIGSYGGNADNLFLLGHSAGAHQVAIIGTRRELLESNGLDLSTLAGVVELDTMALDVPLMMKTGKRFYGPIFGTDSQTLGEVSPYDNIEAGHHTPPFLFVVANSNSRKLMQSRRMLKKLNAIGDASELIKAPNRTHGTLNRSLGGIGDEYGPQILVFMRNHLRGQ